MAEPAHRSTFVTERQAHRVLRGLVAEGYLARTRVGRRNAYRINEAQLMRHPTVAAHRSGELLAALAPLSPQKA